MTCDCQAPKRVTAGLGACVRPACVWQLLSVTLSYSQLLSVTLSYSQLLSVTLSYMKLPVDAIQSM